MSYYEDNLSKWYVSANDKHSTFLNQIKYGELKKTIDSILNLKQEDNTFDTRFDFDVPNIDEEGDETGEVHNEKFSVWVDNDPNKHKLYRLTPNKEAPKGTPKPKQSSGSSSSGGSGGKDDFKSKWYVESGTERFVTIEEFYEEHKKDRMIIMLKPKDVSPTWSWEMVKGKKEVWVWIGKLKSNS